ncbi:MAG TPA: alpha/beta hydrolase domain-containing protein, partial [bacterium]
VATYTGWNIYKAPFPAPDLCDRDGSYLSFAATKAQRSASNDPRLSLEERYGSADAYVAKLTQAAQALVRDRLLLQEDADRYIAQAKAAYEAVK